MSSTTTDSPATAPIYRRAVVHCLIPADLGDRFYRPLRDWFDGDSQITVSVERRAGADRRQAGGTMPVGEERRTGEDRRDAQRYRESTAALEGLDLPWAARRHATDLRLVLSPVPVHPAGWDAEARDLVARARAGERGALDVLWLHHYDRVRHHVERAVGERRAGASTDEVFRVAFDRLLTEGTDVPDGFTQWLASVATEVTRGQWHVA